jgi:hypothetical protein
LEALSSSLKDASKDCKSVMENSIRKMFTTLSTSNVCLPEEKEAGVWGHSLQMSKNLLDIFDGK